ncbi:MAG: DUF5615 family PIN-like protein [Spirochaetia bacterium]|nr:DUF5615 family PIN-like protein [Spirochaetia bacterium]
MKLLFDANLSPTLAKHFEKDFPGSKHVLNIGLNKEDHFIWQYAKDNNFTIVSKDSDFYDRTILFGFPPKIIWIRKGNCSTEEVKILLSKAKLLEFIEDKENAVLVLK